MTNYSFHITLYSLLIFGMIFTGWVFCLWLWFVKSISRIANRFLALSLLAMILWMLRILHIGMPAQLLLVTGPLLYFYVRKITQPKNKLRWMDLLHFTPLLLWPVPPPFLQVLIFCTVMLHLYWSYGLIQKFYKGLQPVLMDRSLLEFRWLRRLLAATALLWMLWIVSELGMPASGSVYIFFAVMIIWMAAAAILNPQAGLIKKTPVISKPVRSEVKQQSIWLKRTVVANKYYLDPELSLTGLAGKLGLTTHELSAIVNTGLKKSFNDFINEYRVQEVASKMQDPAYNHFTLLGIAYESGFNSQTTFTRVLKQLTGKSPLEYKNELKKDYPFYNLDSRQTFASIISNHKTTRKWSEEKLNRNVMVRNYLKIAWRGLWLHKRMTFINIAGLGIGMAAAILIAIWVQNEMSYDRDQPGAGNIYRVTSIWPQSPMETWRVNSAQYILADIAVKEIPEIVDVTRMRPRDYANMSFHIGQKIIQEREVTRVDDHWFKMFHYDFVDGSPQAFNKNLYSLILTQSAAKRFFGEQEPVGKLVRIDTTTYQVEGVVKDSPANSSFGYKVYIPMAAFLTDPDERSQLTDWGSSNYNTFFKLKPNANIKKVAAQLTAIEHRNNKNATVKDKNSYDLINIRDMHFEEGLLSYALKHGNRTMTNVFIALAILLLLTACINYVNLTTARASARSKEVSVRKIVGAGRLQLFGQFMSESFLVSLIAVALSFAMVLLCMPWFREFTGKNFGNPISSSLAWEIVGATLLLSFILNGVYPALLLSSFKPLQVFRGKTLLNFKDTGLRKALVVVQFTISVVLIVGTLVIYRQLRYAENIDLGYDRSQVFTVDIPHNAALTPAAVKQELKQNSAVADISLAKIFVDDGNKSTHSFDWDGRPKDFNPTFTPFSADQDFQRVMKLKMADGRWFDGSERDKHNVVLNETAVRLTGLHKPYIGQRFVHFKDTGVVIGVVKDFHYASFRDQIGPMVIGNDEHWFYAYIKTTPGGTQAAITAAQKAMQKFAPDEPFEYHFVDDDYNKLYQSEQQSSILIGLFASIAIFVSALGLLGLATFAAEQKVKEIGIRKVLGASIQHIVGLLSIDFVKMVIIASFIAFPIAWWAMNKWLQAFAYKIELSWWIFALSGVMALIIALITISFQAIKAALANPVKSLRSE